MHHSAHVIDLHVDSLLVTRLTGYDVRRRHRNPLPRSPFIHHADIPRLREGGASAVGFGVVVNPFSTPRNRWAQVERTAGILRDLTGEPGSDVIFTGTEAAMARARESGKLGAFLGIEGAHAFGSDLSLVERSYELGVRYVTITHFSANAAAFPARGKGASATRPLTTFGRELVDELERIGTVVDLAHVGRRCFMEVLERCGAPVIVSHTGVSGVHPSSRNLDDEQIGAVAAKGGVVGIIFAPCFLSGKYFDSASRIIDHIDHVVEVAGVEHAALGSDFDGFIPTLPEGIDGASDLPVITELLLRRGYPEDGIRKILGENVLRVFGEVERTASKAR